MSTQCAPQVTQQNVQLVVAFMTQLLINNDTSAVDRFYSPNLVHHNPYVATNEDVKNYFNQARSNLRYEPGGVVGNCDTVMVYGRYSGIGPRPMIAVDIFRVANGRLVEHWDVMQEEVLRTASGNPMFTPL